MEEKGSALNSIIANNNSNTASPVATEENLTSNSNNVAGNNYGDNRNSDTCVPVSASQIALARKYEEEMTLRKEAAKAHEQARCRLEEVSASSHLQKPTPVTSVTTINNTTITRTIATGKQKPSLSILSSNNVNVTSALPTLSVHVNTVHTNEDKHVSSGPLHEIALMEKRLAQERLQKRTSTATQNKDNSNNTHNSNTCNMP